mmetsp:Transcript_120766/g.341511  ORF Transcript_120766/g.341511 Transcript_120766/m.341511 type:complete len:91 (-) Transcript_120766:265-537(-)
MAHLPAAAAAADLNALRERPTFLWDGDCFVVANNSAQVLKAARLNKHAVATGVSKASTMAAPGTQECPKTCAATARLPAALLPKATKRAQ